MRSTGFITLAAVASAALRSEEVASEVNVLQQSFVRPEWHNAKISAVKPTVLEEAKRSLMNFAGYNAGVGFIKFTGFSDDDCLHPMWETGMNIGQCMKVEHQDSAGNWMESSFRATYYQVKKNHRVKVEHFDHSGACWGTPDEVTWPVQQQGGCRSMGTTVDGTGRLRSGMYSFAALDDFRFMEFNGDNMRGVVEFSSGGECDHWGQDSPHGIFKYYFQVPPREDACYQVETSTGLMSYRTMCAGCEGDDCGVNHPVNVWYTDDACMHKADHMVHVDMCHHDGDAPHEPIYGGARAYHSRMLPRGPRSGATMEICFRDRRSDSLHNHVTPWNKYQDIRYGHGSGDDDHQGDHYPECQGDHCRCDEPQCYFEHGASKCTSSSCVCTGDDCQCAAGPGMCTEQTQSHSCVGPDCQCHGDACVVMGHAVGGGVQCNPDNNHECHCFGSECGCSSDASQYGCICFGADCGCNAGTDGTSTCTADFYSCTGTNCECPVGSSDCKLFGGHAECLSGDCKCTGPGCFSD